MPLPELPDGVSKPRGPPPPPTADPRGETAVEVTVRGRTLRVRGTLSNGEEIDYTLDGDERDIGRECAPGWWAKGRDGRGRLLLCRGVGYRVENAMGEPEGDDARVAGG